MNVGLGWQASVVENMNEKHSLEKERWVQEQEKENDAHEREKFRIRGEGEAAVKACQSAMDAKGQTTAASHKEEVAVLLSQLQAALLSPCPAQRWSNPEIRIKPGVMWVAGRARWHQKRGG